MFRSVMLRFGMLALFMAGLVLAVFSASTASGTTSAELRGTTTVQMPVGTFSTLVTNNDFNQAFMDQLEGVVATGYEGRWELTLDGQGHYTATFPDQLLSVEGQYHLTSEQLEFYGGKWSAACTDPGDMGRRPYQAPGIYSWRFDGTSLILTSLSDGCAARKTVLESHSLASLS